MLSMKIEGMDTVIRNLDAFTKQTKQKAGLALRLSAGNTVNYAKRTAPWTDRTGNARRSIHEEYSETSDVMTANIGIGEDYGVYLELSNGGKYRIIDPAVFSFGAAEFSRNLRSIM